MRTDTKGLLDAGLALVGATCGTDAQAEFDWADMDRYVIHQVSQVHTSALCEALGIDPERVPLTFPTRGNIGPGRRCRSRWPRRPSRCARATGCCCMGIGSGLNTSFTEIVW